MRKIVEVLKNEQLRKWALFKLVNPKDYGVSRTQRPPPYLDLQGIDLLGGMEWSYPKLRPLEDRGSESSSPDEFRLASKWVPYEKNGQSFFNLTCEDEEDSQALFRFNGPLVGLLENRCGLTSVKSYIENWFQRKHYEESEKDPYAISERLSNLGILLSRGGWKLSDREKIKKDINYLLKNLEYLGEDLTGNHLSNNGRGIIWGGLHLKDKKLFEIGAKIMEEEYYRIIQKGGLLREGSTHYQFLITRNYLEAYYLCRWLGEEEWALHFHGLVGLLIKGCEFVRLGNYFPLIGDISPDFCPQYFHQLPELWKTLNNIEQSGDLKESFKSFGYAGHFFEKLCGVENKSYSEVRDDFARIDNGDFSLLAHFNKDGIPLLPGHAHRDSGSPIITFKGKPFLIEKGRKNYQGRDDSSLGQMAHNSFYLNNMEGEWSPRGVYGPKFLKQVTGGKPKFWVEGNTLKSIHYGYQRHGLILSRETTLYRDRVEMRVVIKGKGRHQLGISLWPQDLEQIHITFPEGGKLEKRKETVSSAYGDERESINLRYSKMVSLPYEGKVVLTPK